jgi:hypothetical protein
MEVHLPKMNFSLEYFYTTIFLNYTLEQLKEHKEKVYDHYETLTNKEDRTECFDYANLVRAAIYSKKYDLHELSDRELDDYSEANYQQQQYMRRCEDAVEDSEDDNKKGFYSEWNELQEEEEGLYFEISRRTFIRERSNGEGSKESLLSSLELVT